MLIDVIAVFACFVVPVAAVLSMLGAIIPSDIAKDRAGSPDRERVKPSD